MAGKISLDDIIDISSFQDLDKLSKSLKQLSTQFAKASKTLEEQGKNFEESIDNNIDALNKYGKTIGNLAKDELPKFNKEVDQLIENNKELKKSLTNVNKEKEELAKSEKKIIDLQTKLNKLTAQQISKQQQAEKDAQESLKTQQQAEKLKQQQIRTAEAERKQKERTAKEVEKLNSIYARESKRLNELRKRYKDLTLSEGKSTRATRKLKREIDQLDKTLKDVDAEVGQFQRNVGNYPDTLGKASKALLKFGAAAASFKAGSDGITNSLNATEEGSKDVAEATGIIDAALDVTKEKAADLFLDIKDGVAQIPSLLGFGEADISQTAGRRGGGFLSRTFGEPGEDGVLENFEKLQEAQSKANVGAIDLAKEYRLLSAELEALNQEAQKQLVIAGDSTKSFDEIEKANINALSIEQTRIQKQIGFIEKEKELIDSLVSAKRQAGVLDSALLDQQAEKETELVQLRGELAKQTLEINKALRENARDRFERELDFAIDAFDAEKTVRERQITNDTLTLEQRRKVFEETERLAQSSFENQIKLAEGFTKQKLNLDELVKESDEEVIRARLSQNVADDVTLGRILEIIRERKFVTQDLVDAENDLREAELSTEEAQLNIANQEKQIDLLEQRIKLIEEAEDVDKELAEFDKKLEDQRIEALKTEVKLLEEQAMKFVEGSERRLDFEQQINEKSIEILEARLEKEKELKDKAEEEDAKRDEKALARQQAVLSAFSQIAQDRINSLIGQSIATAFFNALAQGKTPEEATADAANAGIQAALVTSFTKGFREGGYTGDGGVNDVAGVVHGKEHVNTAEQTAKYNMRGWTASDFDRAVENDYFSQFANVDREFNQSVNYVQPQIVNQVPQLNEEKIGKEVARHMPDMRLYNDQVGHLISQTRQGGKTKRTIHKSMDKPIIG